MSIQNINAHTSALMSRSFNLQTRTRLMYSDPHLGSKEGLKAGVKMGQDLNKTQVGMDDEESTVSADNNGDIETEVKTLKEGGVATELDLESQESSGRGQYQDYLKNGKKSGVSGAESFEEELQTDYQASHLIKKKKFDLMALI